MSTPSGNEKNVVFFIIEVFNSFRFIKFASQLRRTESLTKVYKIRNLNSHISPCQHSLWKCKDAHRCRIKKGVLYPKKIEKLP